MDKFTFTNTQIIGFFVPGFIFIAMIFLGYYNWSIDNCIDFLNNTNSILLGFIVIVFSMFLGMLFDAIRNGFLEGFFDKRFLNSYMNEYNERNEKDSRIGEKYNCNKGKLNWDFFNDADKEKITTLYSNYYVYYVFDINASSALILSTGSSLIFFGGYSWIRLLFIIVIISILYCDAYSLRKEVYFHTNNKNISNEKPTA